MPKYTTPAWVRNPKQWVDTREAQVTMYLNDKLAGDAGLLTHDEAQRAIVELQAALAAVLVGPGACENLGNSSCWAVLLAQLVVARRPEGWTVEDADAQQAYSIRSLWTFLNEFKSERFAHDGRRDAEARSATLVGRGGVAGVEPWLKHGADTSARRANVQELGDDDSLMRKASMLHCLLEMAGREGLPKEILNLEPPKIRTFTSDAYMARKKREQAIEERWQQRFQQRQSASKVQRPVQLRKMPARTDVQAQRWQRAKVARDEAGKVLEGVEAASVAVAAVEGLVSDAVEAEVETACETAAPEAARPTSALSNVADESTEEEEEEEEALSGEDDEWEEQEEAAALSDVADESGEEEEEEEEKAESIELGGSTPPSAHPCVVAPARKEKTLKQYFKQLRAKNRKAAREQAREHKRAERDEAEKAKRAAAVLKSRQKAEEVSAKQQAKHEREERIAASRLLAIFDADEKQQAREHEARHQAASGKYAAVSMGPTKVKILHPSLKLKLPLNGGPVKHKAVRLKLSGAGITKVQVVPPQRKPTLRAFRVKLCGARTLELYGAIAEPTPAVS